MPRSSTAKVFPLRRLPAAALQVIAGAWRPLKVKELSFAMAVAMAIAMATDYNTKKFNIMDDSIKRDDESLIHKLASLVWFAKSDSSEPTVHVVHTSLKEFTIQSSPEPMDLSQDHR
jgi:hypothetical protein